jgi:hypothetical protein
MWSQLAIRRESSATCGAIRETAGPRPPGRLSLLVLMENRQQVGALWRRLEASARGTGPVRVLAATVMVAALAAGCGTTPQATATTKPLPAGRYPSAVSKMVCLSNAIADVGRALGEKGTVSTPTWVDHLYSCRYVYPSAAMALSVKELSSTAETTAYFNSLGTQLGVARTLANLGQGAFQTTNGSVVVRKDYKVLLVDDTGLPPTFGNPPTGPGAVAVTVAIVILGCWAGD